MTAPRGPILTTAHGTNRAAFGSAEWALFVATALMFGSAFLLTAVALDDLHPGVITTARALCGGAVLALFPRARRPLAREDRRTVVVLALLWVVGPMTLVPIAQQWIDSGVAGMLSGAMPVAATAIAAWLLRTRPRPHQIAGVTVGLAGVVLISIPSVGGGTTGALGVALMLVAVACYAVAVNLAVPMQQRYGSFPVMMRMLLVGAVLTAPYAAASVPGSHLTLRSTAAVLALGVFGTAAAYVSMGTLVGMAGSTRSSFVAYLVPVVALGLGVVALGEEVAVVALVGIALVTAGAVLASRRDT